MAFARHVCTFLLATTAAVAMAPANASAEIQIGGTVGGHIFSDNQLLGFNPDSPHRTLRNGVVFGVRVGYPLGKYLVPEIELPMSVAFVKGIGTQVIWTQPRAQLRLEAFPGARVAPFVVIGGGPTFAFSSKSDIYKTSIQGGGYVGLGVHIAIRRNLLLRFDARLSVEAGLDPVATIEGEFGFGITVPLGLPPLPPTGGGIGAGASINEDPDADGIHGAADQCPTRAEDFDDFQDDDGCPDIDNDIDRVLDVNDKCPMVPETINGFEDNDGCPDQVPDEVSAIRGPIADLSFERGTTELPENGDAKLASIIALMNKYPSIKLVLIGHAAIDDIEVSDEDSEAGEDGSGPAQTLSVARATAVEKALYRAGIKPGRLDVTGRGFSEPLEGKTTRANLARTRRVEIDLFVPAR